MTLQTFRAGKHLIVQGDSFLVFNHLRTSVIYVLVTATHRAQFCPLISSLSSLSHEIVHDVFEGNYHMSIISSTKIYQIPI